MHCIARKVSGLTSIRLICRMVVCILLSPPFLLASDNKRENEEQPILLIEPSFLRPPISHLIPGAERTIIVPATMKKNNIFPPILSFLKPGWKTLHHSDMSRFVQGARSHLSETLASLHPKFLRDEHHVIQVALLESTDPLASVTASTILAPDFANGFMNIFGPELLLAIPCANRVYVFSKLASPLESIAPAIRDDYKLSPSPVSTEIFELSNGRLRAIGSLD
ncbi:MAG TPA: hypothetical protein VJK54_05150 [Chthoniobacterales bacterium]|nr:hypothetical protein [Chthoniobacterales bacterium]